VFVLVKEIVPGPVFDSAPDPVKALGIVKVSPAFATERFPPPEPNSIPLVPSRVNPAENIRVDPFLISID
jgi:hypothetical protein